MEDVLSCAVLLGCWAGGHIVIYACDVHVVVCCVLCLCDNVFMTEQIIPHGKIGVMVVEAI
jgi:hypothetical protein